MAVKIGHASIDERGKASGGKAGDQTGREVCTREWYNKPWIAVIRPKDSKIAGKIAAAMEQACANNRIGYDQSQRTTLFEQAKRKKWDISKITTKCETDCSALVAVCVNAAGISVSKDIYTGNEQSVLKNTGKFKVFTESKYVSNDDYLKRGDILLAKGHTAIVLSDGNKVHTVKTEPVKKHDSNYNRTYVTTANLNVRNGAGIDKKILTTVPKGEKVVCHGYYASVGKTKWLLIEYKDKKGYCSKEYLRKQ